MRYPVVFLPGIIAPAAVRYGPLVKRLTDVDVVVRDLAVYDDDEPPPDLSIDTELVALDRAADDAGFEKFHLHGHSRSRGRDAQSVLGAIRNGRLANPAGVPSPDRFRKMPSSGCGRSVVGDFIMIAAYSDRITALKEDRVRSR